MKRSERRLLVTRLVRALGLVFTLCSLQRTAHAAQSRVVLVELGASFSDEAWPMAERRTEAELTSMGFEVVRVERAARQDAERREELERVAEAHDAVAALTVRKLTESGGVELWVADRVTGKLSIRTLPADALRGGNAATLTGLRIVELLHASLLELQISRDERPVPPIVRELAAPPAPPVTISRFALGVGATGVAIAGDMGPAFGPLVRARMTLSQHLTLDVEAMLSLLEPALERDDAHARLDIVLTRADVRYDPSPERRVSAMVGPSAGLLLLRTVGDAAPGLVAREASAVVFLPGLTVGGRWRITPRTSLALDVALAIPVQRIGVRFSEADVARLGAVWGDVTLALMVTL